MVIKFFLPILIPGLLFTFQLYGQKPVDVAESTLKVGIMGEEVFYYGFAEGDQLIFSFEEANGKELKELEIVEMPSSSRFMDYKTKKIENKIINVPRTAIYKFRFTNSAIGVRLCKYKIQRIPASAATQNFNTMVYSHMVSDTSYTTIQEDYLANTDTVIINLQDRVVKVNPISTANANKASFNFILPENTVAWSYYISVDQAGQQVYQDAVKKIAAASGSIIAKFPVYGPLAALAFGRDPYLTKLMAGQGIDYWIMEGENANLFMTGAQFRYMKKGKAVNDYSRMEARKGTLYFCLSNDNTTTPVAVTVKLTVIQVNQVLATRPVQIMHVEQKNKMYLQN
jgi:hypothetical protein